MDNPRQQRGRHIAKIPGAISHSSKGEGWFRVRSSSGRRWYAVNLAEQFCSCPDWGKCKHLYAVEIFAKAVPRPVIVEDVPTFAHIEAEVNDLLGIAEADLANAQASAENWRVLEEIGQDIDAFQEEWGALRLRMREYRETLRPAANYALEIIARHLCAKHQMQTLAQMALDGCSIEQIKQYLGK
jgi:SWIM zinc finger